MEPIEGKRVAFFTTASASGRASGAPPPGRTRRCRRRRLLQPLEPEKLREDLDHIRADVYVIEIKAAAIDVVCEAAKERGIDVVFADNEVIPLPGQLDLDEALRELLPATEAVA